MSFSHSLPKPPRAAYKSEYGIYAVYGSLLIELLTTALKYLSKLNSIASLEYCPEVVLIRLAN